jgi:hypothetical protein
LSEHKTQLHTLKLQHKKTHSTCEYVNWQNFNG